MATFNMAELCAPLLVAVATAAPHGTPSSESYLRGDDLVWQENPRAWHQQTARTVKCVPEKHPIFC